ncbi:MAG: DUF721 domain-containing protein [Deltaproteobacteria bacterium]|nr:DUF721 domain-containing protein [Deltaproteobacteria bacterium]
MNSKDLFPTPVFEILDSIFRKTSSHHKLIEAQIQMQWENIVGDGLARQTFPQKFEKGQLTCLVQNSPLLHQLQFMKIDILKKINSFLTRREVKKIFFLIGVIPARGDKSLFQIKS